MIRLIAIDLDGTLLHEDKTLSKGNIEALHRAHEAGYDIVICTGRPLAGVRPIFEEIGLPDGNYYMIINNGCTTLSTKNWEIIGKEELSLEDMHRLHVLTEDTDVQLTLFDMDHYLVSRWMRALLIVNRHLSQKKIYPTLFLFFKPCM